MKNITLPSGESISISDEDLDNIKEHTWNCQDRDGVLRPYRRSFVNGVPVKIYMDEEITKCPPNKKVIHIDGDNFNCTRENLRLKDKKKGYDTNSQAILTTTPPANPKIT